MKDHSNQRGIEIMKERAYSLHGDLTITSSPGSGTRVELKIPTHAQKEAFLL
jgi:nitrate/nitrite-specific signal transduction histidine kinase